ncbi:3-ketoacyl-(acyl-carrier-protein) reductase [Hyphomicrobium denitrificans 1NES1]|uniref:3-ketoacyl-(Acyl-carrier-protein) reductase n=1 Tax=Hyphomicrobium denitrificans 1NES1 TaxID=670307 RepID=N0BFC6_9HYPH|nr:SDR family oxidoreductase [Hyphomicrobium denitrificans]AGK59151.1 3-ketoacyl-(acyl-carrier-protein) reductase [Hyphomicrobium denitrificans 1NES1]
MRLKDRVAIITGSASGFGRGIAELFAAEGAKVVIADINGAAATALADQIGEGNAIATTTDVTKRSDVDTMIAAAVNRFGGVDILVNNAGVTHKNQSLMQVSEDDFDRIYAVNVKSIYLTTLAVVPVMEKRGGGSIITTASTAGIRPRPGLTWYNGSKGAAITLTKSMAAELAPKNIRVNAINPVIGETGMLEQFMGLPDTPENRAKFVAGIPLGRMSKPIDIANAALFLADPASAFITGVAIEVDGGRCI